MQCGDSMARWKEVDPFIEWLKENENSKKKDKNYEDFQ